MRRAQASSVAGAPSGGTTNTRRRLGVSPGPVGLNGPVIAKRSMCGRPVMSIVSIELRVNGCSFHGGSAERRIHADGQSRAGPP